MIIFQNSRKHAQKKHNVTYWKSDQFWLSIHKPVVYFEDCTYFVTKPTLSYPPKRWVA
jgi:hypothetical protein